MVLHVDLSSYIQLGLVNVDISLFLSKSNIVKLVIKTMHRIISRCGLK